jgi:hypothetical protein
LSAAFGCTSDRASAVRIGPFVSIASRSAAEVQRCTGCRTNDERVTTRDEPCAELVIERRSAKRSRGPIGADRRALERRERIVEAAHVRADCARAEHGRSSGVPPALRAGERTLENIVRIRVGRQREGVGSRPRVLCSCERSFEAFESFLAACAAEGGEQTLDVARIVRGDASEQRTESR